MPREQIVCQFGVQDIADVCGITTSAVFHHIRRGTLVLEDLISVTKFIAARGKDEVRMDIGYAYGRLGEYGPPLPTSKRSESQKKMRSKNVVKHPITRIQG